MLKTHRSIVWRADIERWRWLILGSLGALAGSCGGKTGENDGAPESAGTGGYGGATAAGGTGGSAFSYGGTNASGGAGAADNFPTPLEPISRFTCEQPVTGLEGGWERCANGMIHRVERGVCPSVLPRLRSDLEATDAGSDAGGDAGMAVAVVPCQQDSDCTERAHGHCELPPGHDMNYCDYGCVRDAECDPGFACLCGPLVGSCVPAFCQVDGDCGSSLCASYTESPGCGGTAFQCQFAFDQCASDAECPEASPYCSLQGSSGAQHRACMGAICVNGRPFLIDGEERSAPCVERADWYPAAEERARPAPEELDPELRSALREGWTAQALMEHASVAAFARFALQLASLGAPAELLTRTATAMLDEIRHTRACFALARRYSDHDLGPGPLPIAGALQVTDLASIVTDTLLEGCIGETVAAIEAAEALAHCEDPIASPVLERIVAEESQHAELAWQFVAWALRAGPASLRERVRAVFQLELERAAPSADAASERDRSLLRHGLVSSTLRLALRTRVLREVIAPCAEALLQASGAALTAQGSGPSHRAPSSDPHSRSAQVLPTAGTMRAQLVFTPPFGSVGFQLA